VQRVSTGVRDGGGAGVWTRTSVQTYRRLYLHINIQYHLHSPVLYPTVLRELVS
jgi:hypothetical protein